MAMNKGKYVRQLWDELQAFAKQDTALANKNKLGQNNETCSIFDPLKHRYLLFLSPKHTKVMTTFVDLIPKKIKLSNFQKRAVVRDILKQQQNINYQSLLEKLREKANNQVTYIFGLTNISLDLSEDVEISKSLTIGKICNLNNNVRNNLPVWGGNSRFLKSKNRCYAQVVLEGMDDDYNKEQARSEINSLINIINCLYCDHSEPIKLMETLTEKNGFQSNYFFKKNGNKSWGFSESISRRDRFKSSFVNLNKDKLVVVKGIYEEATQKEKYKKLKNAMDWLGNSLKESNYSFAFLETIISLECIAEMKPKGIVSPSINDQISNFVAMVIGNNLEDRKKIKKSLKNIYNKRSILVHEGLNTVSFTDYEDVFCLVRRVIFTIIFAPQFSEIDDINRWVNEQLLS